MILEFSVPFTQMEDLRHALLYFIRKPIAPQLAILSDAIVANHKLMLLMEWANTSQETKLDIRQHLELYDMILEKTHSSSIINEFLL